jgi:hypothetical protein
MADLLASAVKRCAKVSLFAFRHPISDIFAEGRFKGTIAAA